MRPFSYVRERIILDCYNYRLEDIVEESKVCAFVAAKSLPNLFESVVILSVPNLDYSNAVKAVL